MHVDFIPQGDRTILSRLAQSRRVSARRRKILTTGRRGFHYSGSYPMVFQHSGAQDFDLGGGFHYSGSYPMVFQHSGARRVDLQCPNGNRQTGGVLARLPPPQKLVKLRRRLSRRFGRTESEIIHKPRARALTVFLINHVHRFRPFCSRRHETGQYVSRHVQHAHAHERRARARDPAPTLSVQGPGTRADTNRQAPKKAQPITPTLR